MVVTDPIADMLTRIRNAITAKHEDVLVPLSKEKKSIAEILLNEGYIKSFNIVDTKEGKFLNIGIKYDENGNSVIYGLKRVSKPGLRVYAGADKLPKVINGMGISIISTNKGILTDKQAREAKVGGEVLAYVW
ncbi:MAG: 30S ribosomal protein S8 [Clostridia bacterium]|nr:30S ribosomal protein S8 [Clostridia bacterium]